MIAAVIWASVTLFIIVSRYNSPNPTPIEQGLIVTDERSRCDAIGGAYEEIEGKPNCTIDFDAIREELHVKEWTDEEYMDFLQNNCIAGYGAACQNNINHLKKAFAESLRDKSL